MREETRGRGLLGWLMLLGVCLYLILIAYACTAHAQTSMGPIRTPQVNQQLYVGQTGYATIQSAITYACRTGTRSFEVIIQAGITPTDTPGAVTGGCAGTYIQDERTNPVTIYTLSGAVYVALPHPGILPSTTNIIQGDGAGNGSDSGIASTNVAQLNAPSNTFTGEITAASIPTFNGTVFYSGTTKYPTMQSALTAACALTTPALVVANIGKNLTENISALSGCTTANVYDDRDGTQQLYRLWSIPGGGSGYDTAPIYINGVAPNLHIKNYTNSPMWYHIGDLQSSNGDSSATVTLQGGNRSSKPSFFEAQFRNEASGGGAMYQYRSGGLTPQPHFALKAYAVTGGQLQLWVWTDGDASSVQISFNMKSIDNVVIHIPYNAADGITTAPVGTVVLDTSDPAYPPNWNENSGVINAAVVNVNGSPVCTVASPCGGGPTPPAAAESYVFPAATCISSNAQPLMNYSDFNSPAPGCISGGTNPQGYMAFAAAPAQPQKAMKQEWVHSALSTINVQLKYFTTATTGTVTWNVAMACVADNATPVSPAFTTPVNITSTVPATANTFLTTTATAVNLPAACPVGSQIIYQVSRGSDSAAATANLVSLQASVPPSSRTTAAEAAVRARLLRARRAGAAAPRSTSPIYTAVYPTASCISAQAQPLFNNFDFNSPAPGCISSGSNVQGYMAFNPQPGQPQFIQRQDWVRAAPVALTVQFKYFTTATAGTVTWGIATACIADGASMTTPTFATPVTYNSTVSTTPGAVITTPVITANLPGSCPPNSQIIYQVYRATTDTATATANLLSMEATIQ